MMVDDYNQPLSEDYIDVGEPETRNCETKLRVNPKKRKDKVFVGCGAGFGGDRPLAALKLLQTVKELDYLVLECLAERTLADRYQAVKSGGDGYDPRISEWMELLLPLAIERGVCIITNMGATNAIAAQEKVLEIASRLSIKITVGVAHLFDIAKAGLGSNLRNANGGISIYLGASPIVECLEKYSPNVVITSRVADAALFLAPMVYELGWNWDEYMLLAQGSLAGHLLECGCQLTGGYFMHPGDKYRDIPFANLLDLSLPLVETSSDGKVCVAKADGSGGLLNFSTCAQQLLYEVGDPSAYITPDVVIDFQDVSFHSLSADKVVCAGAKPAAEPVPDNLLALASKDAGWKGWGEISYGGCKCVERAKAAEFLVRSWMEEVHPGTSSRVMSYIIGLDSLKAISLENITCMPGGCEDIRLRMDGLFEEEKHAIGFTEEFTALYTNGPAGGGGISTGYKREILLEKGLVNMDELMDEHMDEHDNAGQNMVEHDTNEQDMDEQPEPQPQRRKRGIYTLNKKRKKQFNGVTFDEHGFAIGDDQSPFGLYVGAVTRAKISILKDDWRKVTKSDKDQLWLEIKEHCRLKNDDFKSQVLKQCNHSWKSFKKDLRTDYMYPKRSPCNKWTFIEPETWKEFVKLESTPEKMAKHEKGREWAKLKKNPPRVGPKGYRGNIDKWEKERASEDLCTDVHKIPDRRGRHYCLARRVHDKVKGLMLAPEMQVIADKLIEAHTELLNSSEVEDGVDPLIMVVGPEHGGRTRGVGHLVGFKKGIEGYVAKKRRYRERQEVTAIVNEKIKEARAEMKVEFDKDLARAISEMKAKQANENPESPLMRKSSCDSASNFDVLDNIQEASKCQLFLPYGTKKILCAIGMVYPAKQVHGKSVLQGHAKVHVDNVEADYKDYILPVTTDEFSKLGQTVLSFIQWPKKYIELTKASNQTGNKEIVAASISTQTGTKQIMAANTSNQTATKQILATNKESSTRKQTSPTLSRQGPSNHIATATATKSATKDARPLNSARKEKEELIKKMNSYRGQIQKRACVRSAYERLMRNPDPTRPMHVNVEPRVFEQSASLQISVSPQDLMMLFTNGWLNHSIITLFATSIHRILQKVKTQSNKCGFLNPYTIQDSVCMFDGLLVKDYLLKAMDPRHHKLFFLAPYVESKHWSLFILVPQQNIGFILDSDMEGKNEDSFEFTNVVQKAFGNMKWNLVECNQQTHYWECGYYVMKWMHQFVNHQQHSLPKTMPWNDKKPFTTKELDDIVSSCISVCGI